MKITKEQDVYFLSYNKKPSDRSMRKIKIQIEGLERYVIDGNDESVSLKDFLGFDDNEWYRFASLIYQHRLDKDDILEGEAKRVFILNNKLSQFALAIPTVSVGRDVCKIENILSNIDLGISSLVDLEDEVCRIVMNPYVRAFQMIGRYKTIDVISDLSEIIHASLISYYNNNFISAFLTIVPVIEGVIQRWLGCTDIAKMADMKSVKKHISRTYIRQPIVCQPKFCNVLVETTKSILENHFYLHTENGEAYGLFNRHIAAHMHKKFSHVFFSEMNICRAFILLDMMSDIYIREKHISDPRLESKNEDFNNLEKIYWETINRNPPIHIHKKETL